MTKNENVTLSTSDKLAIISNLATMLKAGIPILEAVESLREDSKGGQKKVLDTLADDLVQGKGVNYSFARFPKIFDKVTVNVIKASEDAGTLDTTLTDLKGSIKRDIEFNDKIKEAMVYPMLIMVVFLGISLMILTFVIPKISVVFSSLHVNMPLVTKIMIFMSDMILKQTIPLVIALTIIIALGIFIFQKQKKNILNLITKLPYISDLSKKIDVTRFARTLFLLLNSGIPITSALQLSEDVVLRKDVLKAITHLSETVLSGKKISVGLKDYKNIFPTILIKITEAGEKTGTLDKAMQEASEYMDYEVAGSLKTVTTLIEPLMLVLVGIAVGGMIMSIISPIYGMVGQLGGGG
jgi:type II secretory pathway component PulF